MLGWFEAKPGQRRKEIVYLLMAAAVPLVLSAFSAATTVWRLSTYQSTRGKIVDVTDGTTPQASLPVIEFKTRDDQTVMFNSDPNVDLPRTIGMDVPILYPQSRPNDARVATFWTLWGPTLIGLGFSLPFLFGALWFLARPKVAGIDPVQ